MKRYETHYEDAQEGPLCGQANAVETSSFRAYVTCKRCLSLLTRGIACRNPHTRIQNSNGVKVHVHVQDGGTVVEADCACFGAPFRTHSNARCTYLVRAEAR